MDSTSAPEQVSIQEAEQPIDVVAVRRAKLKEWFSGRALPLDRKRYLSALINGKAAFGDREARELERHYRMPKGHLDGLLMGKAPTLGDRIKQFRTAQGLTQQQLADKVGVTQTAVAAWECGKRGVPKGNNLLKLAQALSLEANELLGASIDAPILPSEEFQLLVAFRTLSKDKQLIAIKLVEALK